MSQSTSSNLFLMFHVSLAGRNFNSLVDDDGFKSRENRDVNIFVWTVPLKTLIVSLLQFINKTEKKTQLTLCRDRYIRNHISQRNEVTVSVYLIGKS